MRFKFNHLYYFWAVVREGGVGQAAKMLHLTPQTLSSQIKEFQARFPEPLLIKVGRGIKPSELGERVFEQADQMFSQTDALVSLMDKGQTTLARRLRVGVLDVLPKSLVFDWFSPALVMEPPVQLSIREVALEDMLDSLARGRLDAVVADRPVSSAAGSPTQSRLLLKTQMGVFACGQLAESLLPGFPESLNGAPAFLPGPATYSRRLLDQWLHENNLHPRVVAELEDSALLRQFAQTGGGFFVTAKAQRKYLQEDIQATYIGDCKGLEESYFVVTLEDSAQSQTLVDWMKTVTLPDVEAA